jgi:isoquinoline 1-oxidoreductase subunit beta
MRANFRLAPDAAPAADRRQFMKLAGAGLTLALVPAACGKGDMQKAAALPGLSQTFLRLSPDGIVTVIAKHLDMGQGSWTGLATLVAEELDADWSKVRAEGAPARVPAYGNFAFDPKGSVQGTGGSTAMANSWEQYRKAGATVRAMLVQAAAQQWKVPVSEITVAQGIVSHASGKTAGFGELAEAAAKVPVPTEVTLKTPDKFTLIGKSAPRLDALAKSTGAEKFGIDQRLTGMKYAVVARSPKFGGRVASFDAKAAKAVPDVADVVQIASGIAVVADTTWAAIKGREALTIVWDDSKAETRSSDAMLAEYKSLAEKPGAVAVMKTGDAAAAIGSATKKIEAEYIFPYLAHATMEPMTGVCQIKDGKCDVWGGVQLQTIDAVNAAKAAGVSPEDVTLHTLYAGGSFGRRANAASDWVVEVVQIAKAVNGAYPVQLTWTREDDLAGGYYRPMAVHKVRAGLDAKGSISGWQQTTAISSIVAGTPFANMIQKGVDPTAVSGHSGEQYNLPAVDMSWAETKSPVPVLWWRSVEHTHTCLVKECMMDELAAAAGVDPLDFRMQYLDKHPRHAAVLKLAAEKAGWDKPLGKGRGRGIAVQESFGSVVAQVAEVTVRNGKLTVDRVVAAVDCGTAINPKNIEAQVQSAIGYGLCALLHGKISFTDGKVDQTNFDSYPPLRIEEMPQVEVHVLPSTSPPTGIGEPGLPPLGPAVLNALYAATGKRIRTLPLDDVDLSKT